MSQFKRSLSTGSHSSGGMPLKRRILIPRGRLRKIQKTTSTDSLTDDGSMSYVGKSKVQSIQDRKFNSNTVSQYLSCIQRFQTWLVEYNPDAVDSDDDNKIHLPVMWRDLEPYLEEIIISNEERGEHQSTSKFNNIKSALMYLHEQNRVPMDPETLQELFVFLDGYSKSENDWRVSGVIKATAGKFALPFEAHVALCKIAIKYYSNGKDSYHLYSTLGWNLATRSVNTGQLKYGHMRWSGDCIKVNICGGKTNQDGLQSFERNIICDICASIDSFSPSLGLLYSAVYGTRLNPRSVLFLRLQCEF